MFVYVHSPNQQAHNPGLLGREQISPQFLEL